MTLTLLRLGRSRADDENVHEGRYDSPLTETGRTQALALAARWQQEQIHFNVVVSSPLCRASETAKIISNALGVEPRYDDDLMERDNGLAAGMPLDEVECQYPQPATVSPYAPWFVNGESEAEFHRRAGSILERLVRTETGSVLVVAHGGILNAILRNAVNAPLPTFGGPYFAFGDTGFAQLRHDIKRCAWYITLINDTNHLHETA
jgi:2,3-bisphosphoglycerate-dependent phosphoglycerate mutase